MATISVIVPIYKVEKYINKCIESIMVQSFQDFDLILVDDGSPDACPRICDEYAKKDERIVVIHKKNGGLSDARNAGIDWAMEHSKSQWFVFVDSDDYLHPDYLKTLYDTAQKEDADLVICDFVRVNEQGEKDDEEHSFYDLVTKDKNVLFGILSSDWRIDMAWNKLYKKSIFSQLRFEYGKVHEDEFAIHHVLWNCKKAAIISQGLYYYRCRRNSIMKQQSPKTRMDSLEALISQYEFSKLHNLKSRMLLYTDSFLAEVINLRYCVDKNDLNRYKDLRRRYTDIYFSDSRSIRKTVRFYFIEPTRQKWLKLFRKRIKSTAN